MEGFKMKKTPTEQILQMTCVSSVVNHNTSLETALCKNGKHKKCVKFGGDKNKSRDQVRDKSSRREIVDHVVKKALAILGNSSSESD